MKLPPLYKRNQDKAPSTIINGVYYESINEAANKLGCSSTQLRRHFREFMEGSFSEKEVGIKVFKKIVFTRIKD